MSCGLSEYQLKILWRIAYKNRWCNKHISKEDLVKGTRRSDRDHYYNAIEDLLRKGWLQRYQSQGKEDVCLPKSNREEVLQALKAHEDEYDFIRYLEFIR